MRNFGRYSIAAFIIGLILLIVGYLIGRAVTTFPLGIIVFPLIIGGVLSFITGLILGIIGLTKHQKSLTGLVLNLIFIIILLFALYWMFNAGSVPAFGI